MEAGAPTIFVSIIPIAALLIVVIWFVLRKVKFKKKLTVGRQGKIYRTVGAVIGIVLILLVLSLTIRDLHSLYTDKKSESVVRIPTIDVKNLKKFSRLEEFRVLAHVFGVNSETNEVVIFHEKVLTHTLT